MATVSLVPLPYSTITDFVWEELPSIARIINYDNNPCVTKQCTLQWIPHFLCILYNLRMVYRRAGMTVHECKMYVFHYFQGKRKLEVCEDEMAFRSQKHWELQNGTLFAFCMVFRLEKKKTPQPRRYLNKGVLYLRIVF